MKKVKFNTDCNTIDVDLITNKSHIGINWDGYNKGLLIFDYTHCEAYCIESTESYRKQSVYSKGSKKEYIKHAIMEKADVYCFDSAIELYRWLSK